MKHTLLLSACFFLGASFGSNSALAGLSLLSSERTGIGVQAGTLGYGAYITYDISKSWYLKAEFNTADYDRDFEENGVDYDGNLDFSSTGITLNVLPFRKAPLIDGFRLTAGVYAVDNTVVINASGAGSSLTLGDANLPVLLGANDSLDGEVTFDSVAPYAGIGWDWMLGKRDQFIFSIDAGVIFVGEPDVELQGNGNLLTTIGGASAQQIIDQEEAALVEELEDFNLFPVVKLSIGWKF